MQVVRYFFNGCSKMREKCEKIRYLHFSIAYVEENVFFLASHLSGDGGSNISSASEITPTAGCEFTGKTYFDQKGPGAFLASLSHLFLLSEGMNGVIFVVFWSPSFIHYLFKTKTKFIIM